MEVGAEIGGGGGETTWSVWGGRGGGLVWR